jgi:hypothetical protein
MLDDSLGAEPIDMLLVNVQHLSTVGLRVDVLGWISGVAQLVDAFRQSCLWLYLHGDPARFSIFPRTRYNLVDLTAAIQHYDFHAAFGLHENAGIAVIAVCNFHYHFNFSLLARHCPSRLLLLCLRLNLLEAFLLDALLVLLDG